MNYSPLSSSKVLTVCAVFTGFCLGGTLSLSAATVTTAGSIIDNVNNELGNWRTSTVAKTMDVDGDNVYGSTLGAWSWQQQGYYVRPMDGSAGPSFDYPNGVNNQVDPDNNNWARVDSLKTGAAAGSNTVFGPPSTNTTGSLPIGLVLTGGGNPAQLTFRLTDTTATAATDFNGKVVRFGVMWDVAENGRTGETYTLTQTAGNMPGSTASYNLAPSDNNNLGSAGKPGTQGQEDMYFFNLTNVVPGDTFTLVSAGASDGINYIGDIALDISPIPEPSTWAWLGAGVLGLVAWSLRRRRATAP